MSMKPTTYPCFTVFLPNSWKAKLGFVDLEHLLPLPRAAHLIELIVLRVRAFLPCEGFSGRALELGVCYQRASGAWPWGAQAVTVRWREGFLQLKSFGLTQPAASAVSSIPRSRNPLLLGALKLSFALWDVWISLRTQRELQLCSPVSGNKGPGYSFFWCLVTSCFDGKVVAGHSNSFFCVTYGSTMKQPPFL